MKHRARKSKKGGDFANDAYDASATVGRVMSYFSLAIGVLISIVMIIIGLVLIFRKPSLNSAAVGVVTEVGTCQNSNCTLTIKFTTGGKEYTVTSTANGVFTKGQNVTLRYDSANPNNVSVGNPPIRGIGAGVLLIGVIILVISIAWFWVVQNSKVVAAVSGVGDVIGMGDNIVDGVRD